jgi:hypothetical protein
MLEQHVLLVRPCSSSGVRSIVDGDSNKPLGSARRQSPSFWQRLFGRPVLAVHEHGDEPLLFTIHRAWGFLPRRVVRDAEGHLVGMCSYRGRLVHDRHDQLVAAHRIEDGTFRDPAQRVLAEVTITTDGLRIAFSADLAGEPFIKMLLLAAVLTGERPA